MHVVRRYAELLGDPVLVAPDVLARLPDGQLAARPGAGSGEQFDRIVVLGRRGIVLIHRHRRCGEGAGGVPHGGVLVGLGHGARVHGLGAGRIETGCGLLFLISNGQPAGGFARRLPGVGDHHRDDLPVVPHPRRGERGDRGAHIALLVEGLAGLHGASHVAPGEHLQHPWHGACGAFVDAGDAATGDAAGDQIGMGRSRRREVRTVLRLAPDLQAAIDAGRGGADPGIGSHRPGHLRPPSAQPGAGRARGCDGRGRA